VIALDVEHVSLGAGSFTVEDVSLAVEESEYFVLMGKTGTGKSLLLKAVCGLAMIDQGRIRIDDRDVTEFEPRHRNIGYVPQNGGLFPHLNVRQNVSFALRIAKDKSTESAENVQRIIASLGIESLLDRSVTNLSGGERQKVALARALARRPSLLVLDEPVSALDEPTRRETCRELRRVQKEYGVATLHVCHNYDEAALVSDRVGVMSQGRLVATGPLETLQKESEFESVQNLFHWRKEA
jgi:molybdate/tungstate transport system ATP-binding protein